MDYNNYQVQYTYCNDCKLTFKGYSRKHCCKCYKVYKYNMKHCCVCDIEYNNKYTHCCKCSMNIKKYYKHCCECKINVKSINFHCCIHNDKSILNCTSCNDCKIRKQNYDKLMIDMKYHPRNVLKYLEDHDIEDLDNM
jgi:hypothetical protein